MDLQGAEGDACELAGRGVKANASEQYRCPAQWGCHCAAFPTHCISANPPVHHILHRKAPHLCPNMQHVALEVSWEAHSRLECNSNACIAQCLTQKRHRAQGNSHTHSRNVWNPPHKGESATYHAGVKCTTVSQPLP